MHAYVVCFTKEKNEDTLKHKIADTILTDMGCDYFSIGGRYENIYPISMNTKFLNSYEHGAEKGKCPYELPTQITRVKWATACKFCNILIPTANYVYQQTQFSVSHPYAYIIDDDFRGIRWAEANGQNLNEIAYRQGVADRSEYIVAIDVHF